MAEIETPYLFIKPPEVLQLAPFSVTRGRGLSLQLLWLTMFVVGLSMFLVFALSISHFHRSYLNERVRMASMAAEALWDRAGADTPQTLAPTLLTRINASSITVEIEGARQPLAVSANAALPTRFLRPGEWTDASYFGEIFGTIFFGSDRALAVSGLWHDRGTITVVISEAPLRKAMWNYTMDFARYSAMVSIITGAAVFIGLRRMFVSPILRLAAAVEHFEAAPDDPARVLVARASHDEIGHVERSVATMQASLQETLRQQRRLADVGLGVAKINHDLRNLLSSAQLVSDRLVTVPDPTVQRFAPKLLHALDRAIAYCEAVLSYGKASEPAPTRRLLRLDRMVMDAAEVSGAVGHAGLIFDSRVPAHFEVDADPDQLFRVLMNLMRNAVQAMDASLDPTLVRRITVTAERLGSVCRIVLSDTGPGIPARLRGEMFKPFHGSTQRGGSGLGLAIAAELVRAHGGSIALVEGGPGTTFEIEIPDRPIALRALVL